MMKKRIGRQQALAEREKLFIEATRQQVCKKGLLGVQMAAIARECDYATGTLYHHFASKEDLLMAVCSELTATRREYFRRIYDWSASTRRKMFGFSVAYALFAQHYPEHFRLEQYIMTEVVWQAASVERREQFLTATQPIGLMVEEVVQEAIDAGDVEAHNHPPLALSIGQWSMNMGMHTLIHAHGMLNLYQLHNPYRMLLRNVLLQLRSLNWQPNGIDPFDDDEVDREVADICHYVFGDLCSNGLGSLDMQQSPAHENTQA